MIGDRDVDDVLSEICDTVRAAAVDTLGVTKSGQKFIDKQIWLWTEAVQEKVRKKKEAFKKWQSLMRVKKVTKQPKEKPR